MDLRALLATANGGLRAPRARPQKPDPRAPRSLLSPSPSRAGGGLLVCRSVPEGLGVPLDASAGERGGEQFFKPGGHREDGKKGWIHFVGIGGSGLSALAMLALKQGFEVSGSDIMWSSFMDKLHKAEARLYIGHSISNLQRRNEPSHPTAIVISSAIPTNNEEVKHAKSIGIPIYKRDAWLRILTEPYNLIAISGTHGKSTTAAMLSYVLHAMGDDLIAVVGANVPQFSAANVIPGTGPNFVLEADEYDCCFLGISPYIAVVTSIEWDHVDIFQDEEAVQDTFRKFAHQIRNGGHLILCGDSEGAYALLGEAWEKSVPCSQTVPCSLICNQGYSVVTYGMSVTNEWRASSITPNPEGGQDYVLFYKERPIANVSLPLPGVHNVLNSLAVFATVSTLVNNKKNMHETVEWVSFYLSNFEGVSRRFELIGRVHGCHIYDDYAHHPTEVRAVIQAARQKFPVQALWVVFQPHTYSRVASLMKDFVTAFHGADYVIVTEIYSAREENKWNAEGRTLAALITGPLSVYIPRLEDVADKLMLELPPDKNEEIIILTLGAGDITTLGPLLLSKLQKRE